MSGSIRSRHRSTVKMKAKRVNGRRLGILKNKESGARCVSVLSELGFDVAVRSQRGAAQTAAGFVHE